LTGGVLDFPGVGERVGRLVQQGGEHRLGPALEPLSADEDLG
jgi:hypothetical protein